VYVAPRPPLAEVPPARPEALAETFIMSAEADDAANATSIAVIFVVFFIYLSVQTYEGVKLARICAIALGSQ